MMTFAAPLTLALPLGARVALAQHALSASGVYPRSEIAKWGNLIRDAGIEAN